MLNSWTPVHSISVSTTYLVEVERHEPLHRRPPGLHHLPRVPRIDHLPPVTCHRIWLHVYIYMYSEPQRAEETQAPGTVVISLAARLRRACRSACVRTRRLGLLVLGLGTGGEVGGDSAGCRAFRAGRQRWRGVGVRVGRASLPPPSRPASSPLSPPLFPSRQR